jgi:hypothetical protein
MYIILVVVDYPIETATKAQASFDSILWRL